MEISREALLGAIKQVLPAMAKKETFEQADKIAFIAGRVVAFNDAVAIFHPLPGSLDLDGSVDGKRLSELLDQLTVEVVDVDVDNDKLRLRAGRSRTTFDVLPVSLPLDSVDMTGESADLPETFVDKLKWVGSCCARGTSRPALSCVLVDGGWMQASDSYRCIRVKHGDVELPRMMLPITQVEILVDYPIKRVALSDGKEWVRFETGDGTTLCTRTMAGNFPDLDSVYDDVVGRELQLTKDLSPVIARARIFTKGGGDPFDEEVQLTMRQNQIEVSARCAGAEFTEVVRCTESVDGVRFSTHPKFLDAALESGTQCTLGERGVKFSGADWDHVVALRV